MSRLEVWKEVKKYREAIGVTQQELANKLKVNRSQVTRWEKKTSKPNKYTIYFLTMEGII